VKEYFAFRKLAMTPCVGSSRIFRISECLENSHSWQQDEYLMSIEQILFERIF